MHPTAAWLPGDTTAGTHRSSKPCAESIGPGKPFSVFGAMNSGRLRGDLPLTPMPSGKGLCLTTALLCPMVSDRSDLLVCSSNDRISACVLPSLPLAKELLMSASLQIAERSIGARHALALLRWALVIVFLWFGCMKFTGYEAHGNAPLIEHSPLLSWMNEVFGIQGASDVIGVIELSTALALVVGAFHPLVSVLGATMSSLTFLVTLTFFFSTPGVAEPAAGGFPAISAPIGQFLLKDVVLLMASLNLLLASVRPSQRAIGMR